MELPELPEPAAWLNMCEWSTHGGDIKADKPWACNFWNGPQKPEGSKRKGYSWVATFTENDMRAYAAAAVEAERESRNVLTDDMLRYAMAATGTGSPADADKFRLFWRFAIEARITR